MYLTPQLSVSVKISQRRLTPKIYNDGPACQKVRKFDDSGFDRISQLDRRTDAQ